MPYSIQAQHLHCCRCRWQNWPLWPHFRYPFSIHLIVKDKAATGYRWVPVFIIYHAVHVSIEKLYSEVLHIGITSYTYTDSSDLRAISSQLVYQSDHQLGKFWGWEVGLNTHVDFLYVSFLDIEWVDTFIHCICTRALVLPILLNKRYCILCPLINLDIDSLCVNVVQKWSLVFKDKFLTKIQS